MSAPQHQLIYFGTGLNDSGHFFREIEQRGYMQPEHKHHSHLGMPKMRIPNLPFDPEKFFETGVHKNGAVRFTRFKGWTVMAICGSCLDTRPGSKSVFFYSTEIEFIDLFYLVIREQISIELIKKMPFALFVEDKQPEYGQY